MKKFTLLAALVLLVSCLLGTVCFADIYEYYPDEEGTYTITYEGEVDNEYIIIVLRGIYDETNYVEAYKSASDEDIFYYEQLRSEDDGSVTFGPFAPMAYIDSTVIIGGTNLQEPVLFAYVKSGGYNNIEGVEILGVDDTYTVKGLDSQNVVIDVDAILLDAFGYPAITDEKAVLSVETEVEGVSVDASEGTVTLDKCAGEGTVTVKAVYGEYEDTCSFEVVREESKAHSVKAYINANSLVPVQELTVDLVEGEAKTSVAISSKTFDQYGDEYDDVREGYIDSVKNPSAVDYEFAAAGDYTVKIVSTSNENVYASVAVTVRVRPAYTGNALELYELTKEAENELALLGTTKFVSTDGKDIYPDDVWTTQAKKSALEEQIALANGALVLFNSGEADDASLASYVTNLADELESYTGSFKAGIRVDIESIEITKDSYRIPVTNALVPVDFVISPVKNTDTITWKSSDPETVYVDADGNMVAKENGTVIITATTSTGLTANTTVTAFTKATRIQLAESSVNLVYGDEPYLIKVNATPAWQSEILTWTSSRPDVASVDSNGYVTAHKKAGSTTINVVSESGVPASNECVVKVTLPDWETVEAPKASVNAGKVYKGTQVELSTNTQNAKIYYTLDGSTPTVESRPYVSPITVNSDITVNAIAFADKMFESEVVSLSYTVAEPEISVGSATAPLGKETTVDIKLSDNAGVSKLSLAIGVPSGITVSKVEAGSALAALTFTSSASGQAYMLNWEGTADDASNGVIAKITFSVPEDAEEGEVDITVASISATTANGFKPEFAANNGSLNVTSVSLGDVNSDGKINIQDVILLAQYVAKWPSAVEKANVAAANTNGDFDADGKPKINIQDVILLAQHIAWKDVPLG